jgi:hypothetical protein
MGNTVMKTKQAKASRDKRSALNKDYDAKKKARSKNKEALEANWGGNTGTGEAKAKSSFWKGFGGDKSPEPREERTSSGGEVEERKSGFGSMFRRNKQSGNNAETFTDVSGGRAKADSGETSNERMKSSAFFASNGTNAEKKRLAGKKEPEKKGKSTTTSFWSKVKDNVKGNDTPGMFHQQQPTTKTMSLAEVIAKNRMTSR